ncbi:Fur family transcriptional regulator [Tepidicella baoligensis]|uniref:Fur family transcriptional regulator n=1 Tax=Tepidicella baoligensis TaxID=2707016 RepID=UPI0015D9D090|nr:transcriptional repressor [Tepidicella baoligensis]
MASNHDALTLEWSARLHRAGLRLTTATRAVLRLFAQDPGWGPSHAEVLERLQREGVRINRVTLYRLLDRLATCGLLERHPDPADRLWRFSWALADTADELHPRFECDACHRLLPLQPNQTETAHVAQTLRDTLAAMGHRVQRLDLTIHGTCAGCSTPAA